MGLFNSETIWVLIPLVAIIGAFITKSQRIRATAAAQGGDADKLAQELRDSINRLEARVANLERAVTTDDAQRKYAL